MPKLAFFLFGGREFGGMERRYIRLMDFFYRQGVDVALICTHDALCGVRGLGVNIPLSIIHLVDFRLKGNNWILRKLNRAYGILSAFLWMAGNEYRQIHIVSNPGIIVYIYALISRFLPQFSFSVVDSRLKFNGGWVGRSVKAACSVDCLSYSIGEEIREACKNETDRGKVHVSPCSFTDFSEVKIRNTRDIDVVMMARFSPEKGYGLFLAAEQKLPDGLEIHLCGFGGSPPHTKRARVYACQNPFEVLARAKIFLSLQDEENYPSQALLEAMASGCAVIATDVGETRRLLDESCAILIRSDPDDLALSIKYLLENPTECRRLGWEARERVLKNHTLERFSEYFKKNILLDVCSSADT
ncbi:glycosyltransferase family 4 protein [Castellaniella ginsengisoli]|uniref:Glycosyltransferase family 4 protein n=1 Tax=Castellaniella ginsengisoli TaxID=546114 RepID=A0AB39EQP4_9BURK